MMSQEHLRSKTKWLKWLVTDWTARNRLKTRKTSRSMWIVTKNSNNSAMTQQLLVFGTMFHVICTSCLSRENLQNCILLARCWTWHGSRISLEPVSRQESARNHSFCCCWWCCCWCSWGIGTKRSRSSWCVIANAQSLDDACLVCITKKKEPGVQLHLFRRVAITADCDEFGGVAGATVCMYWLGCPYNYNIGIRHTYTIISRWITVSPRLKMQRQRIEMDKRETQLFDILGILPLISLAAGVSWCSW